MYESYGTIVFDGKVIQDITTRYTITAKTDSQNLPLFLDYIIKCWESPENIAYKLYGSCNYAWIILLSNNIINPYTDWLLTSDELDEYIKNKYGSHAKDIHHYELDNIIYYEPVMGSTPVTNTEYEYDKNEKKRKIRVVYPSLLNQVEYIFKKV